MPISSTFENLQIPECNILSFLFPGFKAGNEPLWLDTDSSNHVTAAGTLSIIKRFAVGLQLRGVALQEAVMVVSPNHIYVPVLYLATAGSGRIFTAANPAYTTDEIAYQMKAMRPAIVLVHPSVMKNCLEAANQAQIDQNNIFQFSGSESEQSGSQLPYWTSLLASEDQVKDWRWDEMKSACKTTTAVVNFSSGTTGLPKGVCISHHNLVANALQIMHTRWTTQEATEQVRQADRWLAFLPWYHAYAQLFSIVVTCRQRSPVYTMTEFDFTRYLRHIEEYAITTLQVVPPIIVMLSKREETTKARLDSIEYVMSAAAPLKSEVQMRVSEILGAPIIQSWGMTETTCTGLMTPGYTQDTTGSVGYLLPNTEAMLVDTDENEVSDDSPGELWIRGPQMMSGYWKNDSATKESLTSDKWLKTGDVATHKDGKWYIVDRRKELIKVKGLQVAPAELEYVLIEHEDVVDAAVVGITLQDQEHPRAYVVLHEGARGRVDEARKALAAHVAGRLAKHKHLTGGVASVDSIPRLQSGKIQRNVVRSWAVEDAKNLEQTSKSQL